MPQASNSQSAELADALTGLGWSQSAARDVARDVIRDAPTASLAERLKIALASLGGNS
jgi:Holliday junction resolvasome RuvABC DNA-binding subunit